MSLERSFAVEEKEPTRFNAEFDTCYSNVKFGQLPYRSHNVYVYGRVGLEVSQLGHLSRAPR